MPHKGKNIKNVNISLHEFVNFRKCEKMYTRENIYVHSILSKMEEQCMSLYNQGLQQVQLSEDVEELLSSLFLGSLGVVAAI